MITTEEIERLILTETHGGHYHPAPFDREGIEIRNDREYWTYYSDGKRVAMEWRENGKWYHIYTEGIGE